MSQFICGPKVCNGTPVALSHSFGPFSGPRCRLPNRTGKSFDVGEVHFVRLDTVLNLHPSQDAFSTIHKEPHHASLYLLGKGFAQVWGQMLKNLFHIPTLENGKISEIAHGHVYKDGQKTIKPTNAAVVSTRR